MSKDVTTKKKVEIKEEGGTDRSNCCQTIKKRGCVVCFIFPFIHVERNDWRKCF